MAKAPASDSIMAADKMKPLLALSKREPVQAAVGMTTDGEGVILLDKKAKPKRVAAMLKASAAKAKLQLNTASLRFGRAEVDPEYDAGMVRFFLNKDAPGAMRAKLVEVVRAAAFQKVELNVDASLEDESDDEQEGQEAETAEGAPPAATTQTPERPPAATAQVPERPLAATTQTPEPPAAPAAPPANVTALARDLTLQAGRIAKAVENDPGQRAALVQLTGEANGKLKAGDVAGATEAISKLRAALDGLTRPAAAGTPAGDSVALRKELVGLIGGIAQAAGDDPARKAKLAKLANDANDALKANNAQDAAGFIAQLRDALAEAPAAAPVGGAVDELQSRLGVCRDDLRQIRDAGARASMAKSIQDIAALLGDNKTGPAASLIDVLETQIAEAVRAARQTGVAADAGHMVEFGKLLLRWRDAQTAFDTNLNAIGTSLLTHPEIKADPRIDTIRQGVAAFPTLVPKFGGALEDALDAGINAVEPAEKARRAAEANTAIDVYRQQIAAAAGLAELEQFASQHLGARLPLKDALDQALVELKQQLAARV